MSKGRKKGGRNARTQSVYVTIKGNPIKDKSKSAKQETRTIKEISFEKAARAIWPVVDDLALEGEKRLGKIV